jgi:DNA-binding MarR family transcriptional regulator
MSTASSSRTNSRAVVVLGHLVIGGMIGRAGVEEITPRALGVLIVTGTDQTVRGLAERLRLDKPSISRAVDVLESRGLVRRLPDPEDGRSVLIRRTAAGAALIERIATARDPLMSPPRSVRPRTSAPRV